MPGPKLKLEHKPERPNPAGFLLLAFVQLIIPGGGRVMFIALCFITFLSRLDCQILPLALI